VGGEARWHVSSGATRARAALPLGHLHVSSMSGRRLRVEQKGTSGIVRASDFTRAMGWVSPNTVHRKVTRSRKRIAQHQETCSQQPCRHEVHPAFSDDPAEHPEECILTFNDMPLPDKRVNGSPAWFQTTLDQFKKFYSPRVDQRRLSSSDAPILPESLPPSSDA
jgi:hypothetical protein